MLNSISSRCPPRQSGSNQEKFETLLRYQFAHRQVLLPESDSGKQPEAVVKLNVENRGTKPEWFPPKVALPSTKLHQARTLAKLMAKETKIHMSGAQGQHKPPWVVAHWKHAVPVKAKHDHEGCKKSTADDVRPITQAVLPHRTDDLCWSAACKQIQLSPSRVINSVSREQHHALKQTARLQQVEDRLALLHGRCCSLQEKGTAALRVRPCNTPSKGTTQLSLRCTAAQR
eukprot:jgi/Ulvmu1/7015/UM033_0074.1